MDNPLALVGTVIAVIGVATEGIGALAMVHYPTRRRLPSPFLLFSIGFSLFLLGAVLAVIGQAMLPELS